MGRQPTADSRQPGRRSRALSPAELPEPFVRDPEVVSHFVDDGHGDAAAQLLLGVRDAQVGPAEDGDAIGHHSAVGHRAPPGEGDAFVQPEHHAAVRSLLHKERFRFVSRTDGLPCTPDTEVFLGDTMGEVPKPCWLTQGPKSRSHSRSPS